MAILNIINSIWLYSIEHWISIQYGYTQYNQPRKLKKSKYLILVKTKYTKKNFSMLKSQEFTTDVYFQEKKIKSKQ